MAVSTTIMIVYTLKRMHNFTHRLVNSSLAKRLKVSILPNIHFLWCTAWRSPHSLSQRFPACKIFTLRFHRCGSHILQRPPLVPRLGDKPTPSPKSRKSHSVLLPRISIKLGKQHVTSRHYHNPKQYIISTHAFLHHHQTSSCEDSLDSQTLQKCQPIPIVNPRLGKLSMT
jgi:hypothetical protein